MRLDELAGIKKFRDKNVNEVIDFIQKEFLNGKTKLKYLGNGANGVALTDGTTVYKFWMFDSAYEDFINYAIKHQDNPFLPKLKSKIRTLPRVFNSIEAWDYQGRNLDASKVKYVKMEYLDRCTKRYFKVFDTEDIVKQNSISVIDLFKVAHKFKGDPKKDLSQIADIMVSNDVWSHNFKAAQYEDKVNKDLLNFVMTLGSIYSGLKFQHTFDYNPGNLAMRGDQIVILDPVYNARDIDLNDRFLELKDLVVMPYPSH